MFYGYSVAQPHSRVIPGDQNPASALGQYRVTVIRKIHLKMTFLGDHKSRNIESRNYFAIVIILIVAKAFITPLFEF